MKEITKEQEKKLYKLMRLLFLVLSILLFIVVENYVAIQIFRRGQVAVQDLPVACEQTDDGKYFVTTQDGYANVYNGTGRTVEDLVVTVRYVTASSSSAVSYEIEAGDFEPYMVDGKFNAYQLSFKFEPKADALTDSQILWLEFDVESYSLQTTTFDYLMIGVFVIGCVSLAMAIYSNKTYKTVNNGDVTSVAVVEEKPVEVTTVMETVEGVEENAEASKEEIEKFLAELEESDILL